MSASHDFAIVHQPDAEALAEIAAWPTDDHAVRAAIATAVRGPAEGLLVAVGAGDALGFIVIQSGGATARLTGPETRQGLPRERVAVIAHVLTSSDCR